MKTFSRVYPKKASTRRVNKRHRRFHAKSTSFLFKVSCSQRWLFDCVSVGPSGPPFCVVSVVYVGPPFLFLCCVGGRCASRCSRSLFLF